jgi:HlyD family secretion protein
MKTEFKILMEFGRHAAAAITLLVAGTLLLSACQPSSSLASAALPLSNSLSITQTAQVSKGDLSVTVTGTGTLVPGNQVDLNFAVEGKVAAVNVQVGDLVSTGKVLAVLDGTDALKVDVDTKKLALMVAQKNLADYQASGQKNLGQALADKASAQAALAKAQENLLHKGDPRCEDSITKAYEQVYLDRIGLVHRWQNYLSDGNTQYGVAFIQEHIIQYQKQAWPAYVNWQYCAGFTDQEILNSQAALNLAEAKAQQTQQAYQTLQANAGLDPAALAVVESAVKDAEYQLSQSQMNLDGATIIAPMDGTVTAVNGNLGEAAGTSAFISLADMKHPQLQTYFDETDLINIAPGCAAQVTFETIPGKTFPGIVASVTPSLVTLRNVAMLQVAITFTDPAAIGDKPLLAGLNASADLTCSQAKNVLLAPVTALHTDANGQYFVYVQNNSLGSPVKQVVTVGIKTALSAEIRSGLKEGDRVVIG